MITLLLLLLIVFVLFSLVGGPIYFRRRPRGRIVEERVYEEDVI